MRRNERASERRQTLERLTEVETHGSILRRPEDRDVRVGRDFKTGKTATDDEGAAHEATILPIDSGWPEEDGAKGVEREAEVNAFLVPEMFHEYTGNWSKDEVGALRSYIEWLTVKQGRRRKRTKYASCKSVLSVLLTPKIFWK